MAHSSLPQSSCCSIPLLSQTSPSRIEPSIRHKNPISKLQVPDYFDIIQQPMWWGAIDTGRHFQQRHDTSFIARELERPFRCALIFHLTSECRPKRNVQNLPGITSYTRVLDAPHTVTGLVNASASSLPYRIFHLQNLPSRNPISSFSHPYSS